MDDDLPDPRAQALAGYLRERAAAFSLSADATSEGHIAAAGMALLDAATLAERLPPTTAGCGNCRWPVASRPPAAVPAPSSNPMV